MADAFSTALAGFRRWAKTAARKLSGDPNADADELSLLFGYMRDYLEISGPSELRPGHIERLLLDVYPRKVVVETREETAVTIAAIRDFLVYLADRHELPEGIARQLGRELDEIEPRFADAVMDPANWGMGRAIATAMSRDGVDFTDQADVDRWIAGYNAGLAAAGGLLDGYGSGFDDDEEDIEPIGIKEAFRLPDEMPPMRLPSEPELAELARKSPLVGRLAAIATWVGSGREVTADGDLAADDLAEAVRELAAHVDATALPYLWDLAYTTDFTDVDDDGVLAIRGTLADEWAAADDECTLDVWATTFYKVLAGTLEFAEALDTGRSAPLDLSGHGTGLAVVLFMNRGQGLPVAAASEMLRSVAVGELPAEQASRAWNAWISAHGDPARMLLDQLADLGAVELTEDRAGDDQQTWAMMTPLGLWAVRGLIQDDGVEIPLLPPTDEMTAADLLAMAETATQEQFTAEAAAWRTHRAPESAARELLAAATAARPGARLLAITEVTELGAAAESAWRDVLGEAELSSYAKAALAQFTDLTAGDPWPADLEPTMEDAAWMLTDLLVVEAEDDEPDAALVAAKLAEMVPPGAEPALFDVMARTSHPDTANVLTLIGRSHPDKKVAKAARRAAYRAAGRQEARAAGRGSASRHA
jgi:hypothetical protein